MSILRKKEIIQKDSDFVQVKACESCGWVEKLAVIFLAGIHFSRKELFLFKEHKCCPKCGGVLSDRSGFTRYNETKKFCGKEQELISFHYRSGEVYKFR
jgi:hypothetical protein